jgi:formate hydrogenlyase transcriptional activator
MIISIAALAPSSGDELSGEQIKLDVFRPGGSDRDIDGQAGDDEGRNALPPDQALLGLVTGLVVGIPVLAETEALRAWLSHPGERSIQLHLPIARIPGIFQSGPEFHPEHSVADWVCQHQQPLVIAVETENRFPNFMQWLLKRGIKFLCAIPLTFENRVTGVIGLASARPDAFEGLDLSRLRRDVTRAVMTVIQGGTVRSMPRMITRAQGELQHLDEGVGPEDNFEGIIGRSAAINILSEQIKIVAPTHSTALISGETGTGKELVARAIQNLGPRRQRPFVTVNCAAIPAGLIESELFGHERGAFTGALNRRTGRFELADGGTLFLDEIGDIPLELQPKLLRVLQEQEFERIGGTQTTKVDVRIVAATSRDLPRMVAEGGFRADLYYRLNVFPLRVPALRERPEDIPLLVRHFVELSPRPDGNRITQISARAMTALLRYPWPGNVRELKNFIERSVILSPGNVLLPPLDELKAVAAERAVVDQGDFSTPTTMKDAQRRHLIQALAESNWVVGGPKGAAARLGLQRTTMLAMMKRLGISRLQA